MARAFAAALMLLASTAALARPNLVVSALVDGQPPLALRGISLTNHQPRSITPTSPLRLELRVTNTGEQPATGVLLAMALEVVGHASGIEHLFVEPGSECFASQRPPIHAGRIIAFELGKIASGVTRSCSATITASVLAPRSFAHVSANVRGDSPDGAASFDGTSRLVFGIAPADVEQDWKLDVRGPVGLVPPGSQFAIDVELGNLGPESDGTPYPQFVSSTEYLSDPNGATHGRWWIGATSDPDCTVVVGGLIDHGAIVSILIRFEPIEVGRSRTCSLRGGVLRGASGGAQLAFYALNTTPGGLDRDFANNVASVSLAFSALPVPSLSRVAVLLGCIALALAARCRPLRPPRPRSRARRGSSIRSRAGRG